MTLLTDDLRDVLDRALGAGVVEGQITQDEERRAREWLGLDRRWICVPNIGQGSDCASHQHILGEPL